MSANELSLVMHQEVLLEPTMQVSDTVLGDTGRAKPRCIPGHGPSEPHTRSSVKAEAAALFAMMRRTNESPESVRELISIEQHERDALLEFTTAKPNEGHWVIAAIHFRELVLLEFNRLAAPPDDLANEWKIPGDLASVSRRFEPVPTAT